MKNLEEKLKQIDKILVAPYRKGLNYVKLIDLRAKVLAALPKKVHADLTEAEKIELKKITTEIFGNSTMFIIFDDEQANNPNLQRWEDLMTKQANFQQYMLRCMAQN